jgi:hypothetical protein
MDNDVSFISCNICIRSAIAHNSLSFVNYPRNSELRRINEKE